MILCRNGITEAVEFSANKVCYIRKVGEESLTPVDCSKEAPRYYLCRYANVEDVWAPIRGVPLDPNGEFELIVDEGFLGGPVDTNILDAKKRCEARGRELLTIENAEKLETIFDLASGVLIV